MAGAHPGIVRAVEVCSQIADHVLARVGAAPLMIRPVLPVALYAIHLGLSGCSGVFEGLKSAGHLVPPFSHILSVTLIGLFVNRLET